MAHNLRYRRKTVYALVALISFCLVIELILMHRNNLALERGILIQKEAEALKVNTLDIIRNVHLLDLGIRGYALSRTNNMTSSMDSAAANKNPIFSRVERSLKYLQYPLNEFEIVRDSTNEYFGHVQRLREIIDKGNESDFLRLFVQDRGYNVWLRHRAFSKNVYAFADELALQAKLQEERAQQNIYLLQITVLVIVIPTLLYTAYFSNRTAYLAEELKKSEEARNALLEAQNEKLERLVHDRTQEILAQNEEIKAQNEEIVSHNDHLLFQQHQIEKQALQLYDKNVELERIKENIISKNASLTSEVERQNHDLSAANKELIEQNTKLEEFAYIISHNLRAPIARLIGLTSIVDTTDHGDMMKLFGMIQHSSRELDSIVKDLTGILSIQRLSPTLYTQIDLAELLQKVKNILHDEIHQTNAVIESNLEVATIFSLGPYIESIFLNLISNAIKYRHPGRAPRIVIQSFHRDNNHILVFEDNGIGIDIEKHGQNIFSLYKRFHFHVEGKGLGLFLVRTQVEALGGFVTVKSQIEHGTTFEIVIRQVSDKTKHF